MISVCAWSYVGLCSSVIKEEGHCEHRRPRAWVCVQPHCCKVEWHLSDFYSTLHSSWCFLFGQYVVQNCGWNCCRFDEEFLQSISSNLCFVLLSVQSNVCAIQWWLNFLFCSSTRWLPTKSCWCDRSSRGARCPGVPTSPWTSWTHHIVEKRWDKHWRQRWEDHSKTLLDLHSGLWLLILPHRLI